MSTATTATTPCIRQCKLDTHKNCTGCHRTIDEIVQWSSMSEPERKRITHRCQKQQK